KWRGSCCSFCAIWMPGFLAPSQIEPGPRPLITFLIHGKAYLQDGKTREAGVIAGVVFEDALRQICRKHAIEEKNVKLDTLISALVKSTVLTDTKAKRARVAAAVRT